MNGKMFLNGARRVMICCVGACALFVMGGCEAKPAPSVASSPSVESSSSTASSSSASSEITVTAQILNGGDSVIQTLCVSPAGKDQFGADLLGGSRIEISAMGTVVITFPADSPLLDLRITDVTGETHLISGPDLSGCEDASEVNLGLSFTGGTGTATRNYFPNDIPTDEGIGTVNAPSIEEQKALLEITCQSWFDLSETRQSEALSQMAAWWESVDGYVVPDFDTALQELTHQAETYNRNKTESGIFEVACELNGRNSVAYTNPLKDQTGEGMG